MVGNYLRSHKHAWPLALGAFPPMAVQLSANLDPCRSLTEVSRQQAGLICDLWSGITAESRQVIPYFPTMLRSVKTIQPSTVVDGGWRLSRLDTGVETHLKQRSFSLRPLSQRVFVVVSLGQSKRLWFPHLLELIRMFLLQEIE